MNFQPLSVYVPPLFSAETGRTAEKMDQTAGNIKKKDSANVSYVDYLVTSRLEEKKPIKAVSVEGMNQSEYGINDASYYTANFYPLHKLAYLGLTWPLRSQIMLGADVNVVNTYGQSALHVAAKRGYIGVVQVLLDRGASVSPQDMNQITPLHLAAANGHDDIVKCLLARGAEVCVMDNKGHTPLHQAVIKGETGTIDTLVRCILEGVESEKKKKRNSKKVDPRIEKLQQLLPLAIQHQQPSSLHVLIRRGILTLEPNPTTRYNRGMSLLHQSTKTGNIDCVSVLLNARVLEPLRSPSNDFDYDDSKDSDSPGSASLGRILSTDEEVVAGDTPLHEAVKGGYMDIIRLLLAHGVNADARNSLGETPLHHAACHGRQEVIALLILAHGVDINATSMLHRTPLHYAAALGRGSTVRLLCSYGARVDMCDEVGRTALHYAATCCKRAAVEALLARCEDRGVANLLVKDHSGKTPLELALTVGRPDAEDLLSPAVCQSTHSSETAETLSQESEKVNKEGQMESGQEIAMDGDIGSNDTTMFDERTHGKIVLNVHNETIFSSHDIHNIGLVGVKEDRAALGVPTSL